MASRLGIFEWMNYDTWKNCICKVMVNSKFLIDVFNTNYNMPSQFFFFVNMLYLVVSYVFDLVESSLNTTLSLGFNNISVILWWSVMFFAEIWSIRRIAKHQWSDSLSLDRSLSQQLTDPTAHWANTNIKMAM